MPAAHILGTHGVPAAYGGFETAAEHVGLHLARRGWQVTVHCQVEGRGPVRTDEWRGLRRVLIPEHRPGWLGTASFDRKSIAWLMRERQDVDVCLTFGYNTGVLNIAHRLKRVPNVINMDGMEWTRARWGLTRQAILLANERCAGLVGTLLVGDHPVISDYLGRHFGRRRVRTITYGAHEVQTAATSPVLGLGLTPGNYATLICRPIPENSILEIVTAWSARRRGIPLVILGDYSTEDTYQRQVLAAASDEIRFVGSIYDQSIVSALRFHSRVYLHGHTVGGTNPSLVEAMAAGNPVIAHHNPYNTWVAGAAGRYFHDATDLAALLDELLHDKATLTEMSEAARERHAEEFTWEHIGTQYERVLLEACGRTSHQLQTADPRASVDRKGQL
ncbi:DUF1972 domain-containing protein [Ornithinimicrobium sufpigmenti]|uniref:DUF1972 domain-containing protein n=1 Tax=Ornithinimicrobium sufpigmenti TaxID=2508882 RepID=UPI001EDE2A00|nr:MULTISPECIES: DUF1972 domain-containing protein [unclassified Ornithinimicrobium]